MDRNLFFPGADLSHLAPIDGGSILGGKPKCLWHSTETKVLPSYSTGFFPNMTICKGTPFQHIPANRAARALKKRRGGVQTNRWNVFQIEICGFANNIGLVGVMQEVADWLFEVRGTPKTCSVKFRQFDSSFGFNNGVRLSAEEWRTYAGHLGHMHAPENDHGDPGSPFPIDLILGGDDMTKDELLDALRSPTGQAILRDAVRHELRVATGKDDATQPAGAWFNEVKANVRAIKNKVAP
jgi:hypothetical protein